MLISRKEAYKKWINHYISNINPKFIKCTGKTALKSVQWLLGDSSNRKKQTGTQTDAKQIVFKNITSKNSNSHNSVFHP